VTNSSNQAEFERRAKALAKLPRAERFDQLLDFPTSYTFKVIGIGPNFWQDVRTLLDQHNHGGVVLEEKISSKGKYTSVSFAITVVNGAEIDQMYQSLESLDKIAYLL